MNEIKQALPLNPVLSTSNDSLFCQKVIHLKNQLFPLTRLFFDKLGNALQIWSAPESQPIALLQLSKLTLESMEPIDIEGLKGVVFGLQMGDVPYELPSDYRWLEPYLFSSADDNNLERVGQMIRIQEAMEENDKKAFSELIKVAKVEELEKMVDRNGASLLCHAAMNMVSQAFWFSVSTIHLVYEFNDE